MNQATVNRALNEVDRKKQPMARSAVSLAIRAYKNLQAKNYVTAFTEATSAITILDALDLSTSRESPMRRIHGYALYIRQTIYRMFEDGALRVVGASDTAGAGGLSATGAGGAGGGATGDAFTPDCQETPLTGRDCVYFEDVVGLEDVKEQIRQGFLFPLQYRRLGNTSRGMLLYGMPGTGKTFIVKAAVNTLKAEFAGSGNKVFFFNVPAAALRSPYSGQQERNIKALFDCAKAKTDAVMRDGSRRAIAIIFIDELDSLVMANPSDEQRGSARGARNAFLTAMDGVGSSPYTAVIGATNNPADVDAAFRRRLSTEVEIKLPDADAIFYLLKADISRMVYSGIAGSTAPDDDAEDGDMGCERSVSLDMGAISPLVTGSEDKEVYDTILSTLRAIARVFADNKFSNSDVSRFVRSLEGQIVANALQKDKFVPVLLRDPYTGTKLIRFVEEGKFPGRYAITPETLEGIEVSGDERKSFAKFKAYFQEKGDRGDNVFSAAANPVVGTLVRAGRRREGRTQRKTGQKWVVNTRSVYSPNLIMRHIRINGNILIANVMYQVGDTVVPGYIEFEVNDADKDSNSFTHVSYPFGFRSDRTPDLKNKRTEGDSMTFFIVQGSEIASIPAEDVKINTSKGHLVWTGDTTTRTTLGFADTDTTTLQFVKDNVRPMRITEKMLIEESNRAQSTYSEDLASSIERYKNKET